MTFVAAYRAEFGVAPLCAVIGLPVSTFYDRTVRPRSAREQADGELAERIEKIWTDSGRTYGSPRVHALWGSISRPELVTCDDGRSSAACRVP